MATPARILNVNDDAATRYVMTRILQEAGFAVLEATTGADALGLVASEPIDLVVLDVRLPDIDGRVVCDRIKASPAGSTLPVLLLSAIYVDDEERAGALESGADAYLTAPVAPAVLVATVRALIRAERLRAELTAREREAAAQAEAARAAAEAANGAKDRLLAILSHELRGPLGAIVTAAAVLDRLGDSRVPAKRSHEIILRQSRHLAALVDDLLDVSRLTSGKLQLKLSPVDFGDLVARSVETATASGALENRRVSVVAEPAWIEGDGARMAQVVVNLLVNAGKFTEPGGTIEVTVAADPATVVLRVTDDGRGIPADLLPHVFELFVQAPTQRDRQPGLGVGLAIVRQLVEAHRGTVEAASEGPGRGSTFIVRLPRLEHG